MSLIQEAALDDEFNRHIGRIQTAIEELEKLAGKMTGNSVPVLSQINAADRASSDLKALGDLLRAQQKIRK